PAVPAELAWSFDADAGAAMLPAHFGSVEWRPYADQLDCRDPDDVVEYLASTPPVEGAAPDERARVVDAVRARFGRGGGRLRVRKDTGLFVCRARRHLGAGLRRPGAPGRCPQQHRPVIVGPDVVRPPRGPPGQIRPSCRAQWGHWPHPARACRIWP